MNIFFISDTHFGHQSPYIKFLRPDGSFLRPHGSAEAGDAAMEENWNRVVRPNDKVYHLGDVSMRNDGLDILSRLNGEKILIRGNHDQQNLSRYAKFFKDVRGVHKFDGLLLTHIPVHPDSVGRWGYNVHGHLHAGQVMKDNEPDPRYFNVSVERINYTPISLEEVKKFKP